MIKFVHCLIILFVVSVFSTGLFQYLSILKDKDGSGKIFFRVILLGVSKLISSLGLAVLTIVISALLLSMIIKPSAQDVMPALYYDGTYPEYNGIDDLDIFKIESIVNNASMRLDADSETANYDLAFAYYSSGNYDLAINALKICADINPKWSYFYDIGICYAYVLDYESSKTYLEQALDMDPPLNYRGDILDAITMIDGYFNEWLYSLFSA